MIQLLQSRLNILSYVLLFTIVIAYSNSIIGTMFVSCVRQINHTSAVVYAFTKSACHINICILMGVCSYC